MEENCQVKEELSRRLNGGLSVWRLKEHMKRKKRLYSSKTKEMFESIVALRVFYGCGTWMLNAGERKKG